MTLPSCSYKLDITVTPKWYDIYRAICQPVGMVQWKKELEKKIASSEETDLWQKSYLFTEHFDVSAGTFTRLQKVFTKEFGAIDSRVAEFGDTGYIFASDLLKKERGNTTALIELSRDAIRIKPASATRADLFVFPLAEVLPFLLALGKRFPGMEDQFILKWPEAIARTLTKHTIMHFTNDRELKPAFDLERTDPAFYESWGRPQVSSSPHVGIFVHRYAIYSLKLKVLRANEFGY